MALLLAFALTSGHTGAVAEEQRAEFGQSDSKRFGGMGGGISEGGLFSELWMLHSRHHHSYKYASLKAPSLLKWILASSTSIEALWLQPSWTKYW